LQARGGGKEVLSGKRGGRDGSLESLTIMLKKFACLGLFLYHYYSSRVSLGPEPLGFYP